MMTHLCTKGVNDELDHLYDSPFICTENLIKFYKCTVYLKWSYIYLSFDFYCRSSRVSQIRQGTSSDLYYVSPILSMCFSGP